MYYVNFNEQKLPIYFDYSCIKQIKNEYGIDLTSQSKELEVWIADSVNQEKLIFAMLQRGHKRENKELEYKMEDVEEMFNEKHFFADAMKIYVQCATDFMTPSNTTTEGKKK